MDLGLVFAFVLFWVCLAHLRVPACRFYRDDVFSLLFLTPLQHAQKCQRSFAARYLFLFDATGPSLMSCTIPVQFHSSRFCHIRCKPHQRNHNRLSVIHWRKEVAMKTFWPPHSAKQHSLPGAPVLQPSKKISSLEIGERQWRNFALNHLSHLPSVRKAA